MSERAAIVDGGGNVDHAGMRLDERDEWKEEETIETVLVQVLWSVVACGEHDTACFEEGFEDVGENQCIGNVRDLDVVNNNGLDMELIETNQRVFQCNLFRHLHNGVLLAG